MNEHDFWTQQQTALRQVHQETALHHGGRPPVEIEPMYPERRTLNPSRNGCQCGQGWNWNRWWADWVVGGVSGLLVMGSAGTYIWRDFVQADARLSRTQATLLADLKITQESLAHSRLAWLLATDQLRAYETTFMQMRKQGEATYDASVDHTQQILQAIQAVTLALKRR